MLNRPHIVDINGLASVLKSSRHTLKKRWQRLPHFYIGEGQNLKGARFDVPEVITYLKEEAKSRDGMEGPKKDEIRQGSMGRKNSIPKKAAQKRGVQNKGRGKGVGSGRVGKTEESRALGDSFNLLAGLD